MKLHSQIRVGAGGNTARPKRASATSRVNALAVQNGNLGLNWLNVHEDGAGLLALPPFKEKGTT
jgi:hypothetical protein